MEGKGIIRFFLIILAVVCLLQYFYLLPTRKTEKAADAYSCGITRRRRNFLSYRTARIPTIFSP